MKTQKTPFREEFKMRLEMKERNIIMRDHCGTDNKITDETKTKYDKTIKKFSEKLNNTKTDHENTTLKEIKTKQQQLNNEDYKQFSLYDLNKNFRELYDTHKNLMNENEEEEMKEGNKGNQQKNLLEEEQKEYVKNQREQKLIIESQMKELEKERIEMLKYENFDVFLTSMNQCVSGKRTDNEEIVNFHKFQEHIKIQKVEKEEYRRDGFNTYEIKVLNYQKLFYENKDKKLDFILLHDINEQRNMRTIGGWCVYDNQQQTTYYFNVKEDINEIDLCCYSYGSFQHNLWIRLKLQQ